MTVNVNAVAANVTKLVAYVLTTVVVGLAFGWAWALIPLGLLWLAIILL